MESARRVPEPEGAKPGGDIEGLEFAGSQRRLGPLEARLFFWLAAGFTIAVTAPGPALAQAWLPPKGEASLSEGAQYLNARYHLLWDGRRDDRGVMEWYHAITDLSYGVTDRFAVRVGIPYVVSRYTGIYPHLVDGRAVNEAVRRKLGGA